jgi:hypothetical protein
MSLSHNGTPPQGWAFGFTITSDHVWDGVIILTLLEECRRRHEVLVVPHTGLKKDRFTNAVREHNTRETDFDGT